MAPAFKVSLVLLLLAVDWACDTQMGTCPWSRAWASTEAVCHSAVYRAEVVRACNPTPPVDLALPPAAEGWPPRAAAGPRPQDHDSFPSPADRLYALKALRR
jgi:hypothetical protein